MFETLVTAAATYSVVKSVSRNENGFEIFYASPYLSAETNIAREIEFYANQYRVMLNQSSQRSFDYAFRMDNLYNQIAENTK